MMPEKPKDVYCSMRSCGWNCALECKCPNAGNQKRAGAKAERERILDFFGGRLDGMTSGEFVQIPNMRDWLKAELNKR